jgi:hypothetical protein
LLTHPMLGDAAITRSMPPSGCARQLGNVGAAVGAEDGPETHGCTVGSGVGAAVGGLITLLQMTKPEPSGP